MTHHLPQWLSAIFSSFHFNFYPAIFAFVPICFFPMTFIESRLAYRVVISMQGIQILVVAQAVDVDLTSIHTQWLLCNSVCCQSNSNNFPYLFTLKVTSCETSLMVRIVLWLINYHNSYQRLYQRNFLTNRTY